MGTVLTVMNMKGGVGKTTVACLFSGLAAREKLGRSRPGKILLIDYDPQFNASQAYLSSENYNKLDKHRLTTLSILIDDPTVIDPFAISPLGALIPPTVSSLAHNIYEGEGGRLDIIPSTLDLMYVALGQPARSLPVLKQRFSSFITNAKREYDIVVIDCHPAGSVFTQTSLSVSDHVLVPVKPEGYAVRGLGLMRAFIEGKGPQPSPIKWHILFNQVGSGLRSADEDSIRGNARFARQCMKARLRTRSHFSKQREGKGFVWDRKVSRQPEALANLREVSTELLERIIQ